jgi:hypothetical protein
LADSLPAVWAEAFRVGSLRLLDLDFGVVHRVWYTNLIMGGP